MATLSHKLFRSTAPSQKLLLKSVPLKRLLLRIVPREIQREFQLTGWFVIGELLNKRPSLTVFWTISEPQYDHSLILISKLTPFTGKHIVVDSWKNPLPGSFVNLVIDAFGILSFGGRGSILRVRPTWFVAAEEPEALKDLITAVKMIQGGHCDPKRTAKLLDELEKFKGRPFDRIERVRGFPRRNHSDSALHRQHHESIKKLDQWYGFTGRAQSFKRERAIFAERPERLQYLFRWPHEVVAQLKEEAHNVERSYKLMLEPEYLSAEVRATFWLWHFLGLESQSSQHKPKNVRTNVRDLLEFLTRLNFHFAKRALARLPAAEF
jgi:hypothetical protein